MRELSHVLIGMDDIKDYPLSQWTPTKEEDIGLSINARTDWLLGDEPITHQRIVHLLCKLLVRVHQNGLDHTEGYVVITPDVAYPVRVADTAFLLVDFIAEGDGFVGMSNRGESLKFTTQDIVYHHHAPSNTDTPALLNPNGCWVRFNRKCAIDWALVLPQ